MFTRVEVKNFRSLRDVSVPLSNFHVLVGANGSGKTTFLDVFAFMGDLINDGPTKAVLKRKIRWEDLVFNGLEGYPIQFAFEALLPASILKGSKLEIFDSIRYQVQLYRRNGGVNIDWEISHLFSSSNPRKEWRNTELPFSGQTSILGIQDTYSLVQQSNLDAYGAIEILNRSGDRCDILSSDKLEISKYRFANDVLALGEIPEDLDKFPALTWLKGLFGKFVQTIELIGNKLRDSSKEEVQEGMVSDGSNLPWLIRSLQQEEPKRFADWISHITTGLPNIQSINTIPSSDEREMYLEIEYKTGLKAKSWMVSEGTLRLLALTLIAYHPKLTGLFLIEEPENGIHPLAIETIFASLSHIYDAQAFVTTHSPLVVSLVRVRNLLCFSKNEDGSNSITVGTQHPMLLDWRDNGNLSILFASGILD